jgi:uncharacterized protein (DUF3820 family)
MINVTDLLITIGKASWFGELGAFCFFLYFAIKDKAINAGVITTAILIFLGAVMRWYSPILLAAKTSENIPVIMFIWYIGFMAVHAIGIAVLYLIHTTFIIRYSMLSKMLVFGYFALTTLQMARYGERLLIDFDSVYLRSLYQAGVPAVNIGMATMTLCFAFAISISRYRISKGQRGLPWVL